MNQFYVGIDPGREGGFGLLSSDASIVGAWAMPKVKGEQRGVPTWNVLGIFDAIRDLTERRHLHVGLEWNTSRPGEVPDFAFRFGLQTGEIHGLLHQYDWTINLISPNKWKGKLGLPGKTWDAKSEQGAKLWDAAYPNCKQLIRGPRGGVLDGPLDALLIAHFLKVTYDFNSPVLSRKNPPKYYGKKP